MSDKDAAQENKNVFDKKTAESEFERYCGDNDIDCDTSGMTEDERKDFEPIKKRFVKACMQGRVKADGINLVYTISNFTLAPFKGKEIVIKRPAGQAFMGMDGFKDTQSVRKIHGFLAAMTGEEMVLFSKLDKTDWLFLRDIATLFLAD